jgi:cellulose synthase/poly-beta-1,6-N-acetylglucosamine synthase-like glycosyltransferase
VDRTVAHAGRVKSAILPERFSRSEAGKVRVDGLPYEVIANLDADITFEKDYFTFLLGKLAVDPLLGVVGTPYVERTARVSTTSLRA